MASMIATDAAQSEPQYRRPSISPDVLASQISYPVLTTRRFRFRPFLPKDIGQLAVIAGKHRIADTTIGVPRPFTNEFARMWISSHATAWAYGSALHWAATRIDDNQLVGYAGLNRIDTERRQAELRYWVGSGGQHFGYAAEWSEAMVEFALMRIELNRVYALQLARHALAGRVLASVGMQQEGLVRKRIHNEGLVEDIICWAISKEEWHSKERYSTQ